MPVRQGEIPNRDPNVADAFYAARTIAGWTPEFMAEKARWIMSPVGQTVFTADSYEALEAGEERDELNPATYFALASLLRRSPADRYAEALDGLIIDIVLQVTGPGARRGPEVQATWRANYESMINAANEKIQAQ